MPSTERGFTYLGLLVALALGGAALAALGTQWAVAAQRERERELQFRGEQIRRAVERYWLAQEPHELPPTLGSLLVDGRTRPPRHHLRRLAPDPTTGRIDWELVADPQGRGLVGVASRSRGPRYVAAAPRRFVYSPAPAASGPAPTASSP